MKKLSDTMRQQTVGPVALIVVDTLSRAMPGADENLQKEMTVFVANCDALKRSFGCSVLGVHHSNKDGADMRGSTVLRGAGDYVFKLEAGKEVRTGTLRCEKQKNAPDNWSQGYRFAVVDLLDGATSLVPVREEGVTSPDPAEAKTAASKAANEAKQQIAAEAVWAVLGGAGRIVIGDKWVPLRRKLEEAGWPLATKQAVRDALSTRLDAGVTIVKDGVPIRVQAFKLGAGRTGTWEVSAVVS